MNLFSNEGNFCKKGFLIDLLLTQNVVDSHPEQLGSVQPCLINLIT